MPEAEGPQAQDVPSAPEHASGARGHEEGDDERHARLRVPPAARQRAAELLPDTRRPLIGVQVGGGRAIKQWDPARFAEVATRMARERGARIVLTGGDQDRALADRVVSRLPAGIDAIDLVGRLDLIVSAAVLERLALLITGDTGPMHLASAVGTPVVAIFGLSDPVRYGPRGAPARVVRVDLPCSPCNRVRLPPARCAGHVPDCLDGVTVEAVCEAAAALLGLEEAGAMAREWREGP